MYIYIIYILQGVLLLVLLGASLKDVRYSVPIFDPLPSCLQICWPSLSRMSAVFDNYSYLFENIMVFFLKLKAILWPLKMSTDYKFILIHIMYFYLQITVQKCCIFIRHQQQPECVTLAFPPSLKKYGVLECFL